MRYQQYRVKLDNLKMRVTIANNYYSLLTLVSEYQELAEDLLLQIELGKK